jgi:hypothetical protein
MALLLILNLLTGMRLGWGYSDSQLGGFNGPWANILHVLAPRGSLLGVNVLTLHITLAFLLLLTAGVYIGYLVRSKASQRLRVTAYAVQQLRRGFRRGCWWRHRPTLWAANLVLYWVIFAMIVVLTMTGVALYRVDWGLHRLGGYATMRLVHGLMAYGFVPCVLLHVALQWAFRGLASIFGAQFARPHLQAGAVSLAVTLPLLGMFYIWDKWPTTLVAARLPAATGLALLNDDSDPLWERAAAVTVRTVKGINNPRDYVEVMIKAWHDGERVFLRFQWADPEVSSQRYPLLKTAQGWKVLQTAMQENDENVYYEDKLAVYFTRTTNGSCAATCHLGVGPPGVRKGVHYTTGEIGDVWHWKSVRTEPMHALSNAPGYMDDQYFGPPDPLTQSPPPRYTGGYHADPSNGGGYRLNFTRQDPIRRLTETIVRPIMLPPVHRLQPSVARIPSENGLSWWIDATQGIPYTERADTYPLGTVLPNIVLAPLTGDRADVRARASWHAGQWVVKASRVLDTGSPYDVALLPGAAVYLSVATFNRTQIRHSEHLKPLRLLLRP